MHIERRPLDENTPERWTSVLAQPGGLTWRRRLALRRDPRYHMIRQWLRGPLLDAGCGMGDWVAFLNDEGIETWGLDYSAPMIEHNRRVYPESRWHVGSVAALPLADASCNGIISWGVIEHDPDGPAAAIREFGRVLGSGGRVLATTPRDCPAQRLASKKQFPDGDVFFQHFWTSAELADHFRSEGLEVEWHGICSRAHPAVVWPKLYGNPEQLGWRRLLLFGAALLPARRFGNMVGCVARKP